MSRITQDFFNIHLVGQFFDEFLAELELSGCCNHLQGFSRPAGKLTFLSIGAMVQISA